MTELPHSLVDERARREALAWCQNARQGGGISIIVQRQHWRYEGGVMLTFATSTNLTPSIVGHRCIDQVSSADFYEILTTTVPTIEITPPLFSFADWISCTHAEFGGSLGKASVAKWRSGKQWPGGGRG